MATLHPVSVLLIGYLARPLVVFSDGLYRKTLGRMQVLKSAPGVTI